MSNFNQIVKISPADRLYTAIFCAPNTYTVLPDSTGNYWCLCYNSHVVVYDQDLDIINQIKQKLEERKPCLLPAIYSPGPCQTLVNMFK